MDKVAIEFAEVAERYCSLVETYDGEDWDSFGLTMISLLAELIFKAHQLPDAEATDADLPRVAESQWKAVFDNLSKTLKHTYYWSVFSPTELEDNQPSYGDLADDLADIWRDLKPGLVALTNCNDPEYWTNEAIWQWRFGLTAHWGNHAAEALSCLQRS